MAVIKNDNGKIEIMQFGVSVKEYTEDGKRYVKINELVCEIDDSIDRGCLLFNLLYCTPSYLDEAFYLINKYTR